MIVGRLIPAGTGAYMHRMKRLATERDKANGPVGSDQEAGLLSDMSADMPGDMSVIAAANNDVKPKRRSAV